MATDYFGAKRPCREINAVLPSLILILESSVTALLSRARYLTVIEEQNGRSILAMSGDNESWPRFGARPLTIKRLR